MRRAMVLVFYGMRAQCVDLYGTRTIACSICNKHAYKTFSANPEQYVYVRPSGCHFLAYSHYAVILGPHHQRGIY